MEKQVNIIEKIFQNRILSHTLFWLSTLIIFAIYGMGIGWSFLVGFVMKLFFLPIQIAATYYLLYYQVPTFLYKKRYFRFAISLGLSALVFCTLAHLIEDFGLVKVMKGYSDNIHTFWEIVSNPFANVGYSAEDIYLTVFIVAGLKFIKDRIDEKTEMDILEQEKAKAEINLLKAQINPRILSKTLHQLHKLTKEKSDAAPEVVIKLSEMLDYMLYQCNDPKVLISKEIELVQHYVDLKKLEHGDHLEITFYHSLENKFSKITPLLLLTMVELYFQTNAAAILTYPDPSLEILLKETGHQLDVEIYSKYLLPTMSSTINFRKQLDLTYPDSHTFDSGGDSEQTKFHLTLNLENDER